jgi:hypothetical protein
MQPDSSDPCKNHRKIYTRNEFSANLSFSVAVTVFARRHSCFAAENGGEVLTGGEAEVVGNVRNVLVCAGQSPVCFLNAAMYHIFVQGVAGFRFKPRAETGGTQAHIGRHGVQSQFTLEDFPFQPFQGAPHMPGDHRLLLRGLLVPVVIAEDRDQ